MGDGLRENSEKLRLFLHVGVHKTGSTSLQFRFSKHPDTLRKHGILYPLGRFREHPHQHSEIVNLLTPGKGEDLASLLEGIREEAASCGCHTIVLSGENISTAPREALALLSDALRVAGFRPVVVMFFRPLLDHLRSLVSEDMKSGRTFVTPSTIASRLRGFSDAETYGRFASVFGEGNVIRHDLANGEDCVPLFDADMGLNAELPSEWVNTRIDFATLSWLNALKGELDAPIGLPQRLHARYFRAQPAMTAAEAGFILEVARHVGGEKGALLKAQLQEVEAGDLTSIEAQIEYLSRFSRFVAALRRHMRRRALRRKLKVLFGGKPGGQA